MDFAQVQAQLTDLPATFRRLGNPFGQLIDALTAQMTRSTVATDGQVSQLDFSKSQFGWVDAWGLLMNLARPSNQPDSIYKTQIQYTVNSRGGPVYAIGQWIWNIFGVQVEIIENFPAVGYTIIFPATLTTFQINLIVASINYVRPAGVPFNIEVSSTGTYLQTVNFVDAPRITGAYLTGGTQEGTLAIGAGTNNSPSILPTFFLSDPTLNPNPPI